MKVKLIFACGPDGEFGNGNGLPWNIPEDLQVFKEYTKDCVLVMSGATFESLPGKLPGRKHCVLSDRDVVAKNGSTPDYLFEREADPELVRDVMREEEGDKDLAVIGGRLMIAGKFLDLVDDAQISWVHGEHVGEHTHTIDEEFVVANLNRRLKFSSIKAFEKFTVTHWVK